MRWGLAVAITATSMALGAGSAAGDITGNSIDNPGDLSTGGTLTRLTGPVRCDAGERVVIGLSVTQRASAAVAVGAWRGRCTGRFQRWVIRARTSRRYPFREGSSAVCAVGVTTSAGRRTDAKQWCQAVTLSRQG